MFSSVARLRLSIASILLFLPSFARAHENTLFASSVSYCAPPEILLIQQFDIAYIQKNNTINFNISAASVLPDIAVTANLLLNVYGMQPLNFSLDLCSVLRGALCPLPTYNFTGSDSIRLPASVDLSSLVPAIAYKIPDLEAFAQLTLTEPKTGKVRACIQSTLSNGWSTRQEPVSWATGGITFLAFISALIQSHVPGALAPVRLLDLLYLFQTIAASGLLGLNYPSVYRSFTINFSWALGLFITSPSFSIQHSIDSMRRHTGGVLADGSDGGNPISLVNRRLSPFNVPDSPPAGNDINPLLGAQSLIAVATVTDDSSNLLQAGVPIYVNTIGIATANAFMTVFLTWLVFVAVVLSALALGYVLVRYSQRWPVTRHQSQDLTRMLQEYPTWARAWALRAALVSSLPILIFVFWQWTLKDSWLSILFSVIALLAVLALVLPAFYSIYRHSRNFKESVDLRALEPLAAPYRPTRAYTGYLFAIVGLAKALTTAFGRNHGLIQAIIVLAFESLLLCALLVLRPHHTRGADILQVFLAVVRVVCSGLLIALAQPLQLMPIPRVVVGIVTAAIFSLAVVVMFFDILGKAGLWSLISRVVCFARNRRGQRLASETSGDSDSEAKNLQEKQGVFLTPVPSSLLRRPHNPSPTHTRPQSSLLVPVSASSSAPSEYSENSTSTLGETLPRRWSLQHSRPPSASATSAISPSGTGMTFTPTASPNTPMSNLAPSRLSSGGLPTPVEARYGDESRT